MRIVIALGGNALLRRGEPLTAENQRQNVRIACEQIAKIYPNNELVIAHGNGPKVGLLALQGAAYKDVPTSIRCFRCRICRNDWLYDSTRIR